MTDFWADRIKLNPSGISIGTRAEGNPGTEGSVDSAGMNESMDLGYGLQCQIKKTDSMGQEQAGPKNLPATWSSGPDNNDYLANQ
jgi:hypothetical protein